jgi:hypothetical protein
MRVVQVTCDGCLEPIEDGVGWFGLDEFIPPDEDDDEDEDPEDDEDYGCHFCRIECIWAWVAARLLETTE